ncbi:hypothetical protein D3C72_1115280 [compost metagenome]
MAQYFPFRRLLEQLNTVKDFFIFIGPDINMGSICNSPKISAQSECIQFGLGDIAVDIGQQT